MSERNLHRLHPFGWKSCSGSHIIHKKSPKYKHFSALLKFAWSDRQTSESWALMHVWTGETSKRSNKPKKYALEKKCPQKGMYLCFFWIQWVFILLWTWCDYSANMSLLGASSFKWVQKNSLFSLFFIMFSLIRKMGLIITYSVYYLYIYVYISVQSMNI